MRHRAISDDRRAGQQLAQPRLQLGQWNIDCTRHMTSRILFGVANVNHYRRIVAGQTSHQLARRDLLRHAICPFHRCGCRLYKATLATAKMARQPSTNKALNSSAMPAKASNAVGWPSKSNQARMNRPAGAA